MKKIPKTKQRLIARQYHSGANIKDLVVKYRIPKSTLYSWINKYPPKKQRSKFLASSSEQRNLQKYADKLDNELNILQSFLEYKGIDNKERYEFMDLIYGNFTIHEICGAFNIDRTTYYNHLHNKDKYTYFRDRNAQLDPLIYKIHEDFKEYGAERITIALKDMVDEPVSEDYVRGRMRYLGIESNLVKRSKPKFLQWNTRKQTLLVKQHDITDINQVWIADITETYIKGVKRYISTYEDAYSRKIISWNVGYGQSTQLVRRGLDSAVKTRHPGPGLLILHTDGGAQYNSWTMRRLYAKYKIRHSSSRPSMPTDNPKIADTREV